MKRLVALALPALFVVASCGGDDNGASGPASGGSPEAWCTLGAEVLETGNALDDLDVFDPDAVRVAFDELGEILDEARAAAPGEIRGDVDLTAEAFATLRTALEDVDFDFFALDETALADFDDQALETAGERIEDYNRRVCGFDADDDGVDDDASGTDGTDGATPVLPGSGDDDGATPALPGAGDAGIAAMFVEQLATALEADGFTADEARCVAESYDLEAIMSGAFDADAEAITLDVFEQCGISADRLAEIGG